MRNLKARAFNTVRNIFALVGVATFAAAIAVQSIGPGWAQLSTPLRNPVPRVFQTQQVHYLRFVVNFNSCVLAAGTCSYRVGALPYNAFLIRATQQIITNFNSGTTDTVALATSSGGAQIVAAQTVHAGAGGATSLTIVAANVGIAATGNGIAQTGFNGGFDVWAVYAQTGAAPTAGQAVYVLEYIGPNDGACAFVPLGATAGAC
ncbi:MAG TPA: hypothetical protein VFV12_08800 [Xanthobacteraceae bacterium]|nr:hypothetical protein [Xanthobacteraceae bacterium]